MADPKIKAFLKQHRIFAVFNDDEFDSLIENLDLVSFSIGEDLVREGDEGDCAYLIYSGKARVYRHRDGGRPLTLGMRSKGDMVGETAILTRQTRNASIRASEDVVAFRLDQDIIKRYLDEHPAWRPYFEMLLHERALESFLRLSNFVGALPPRHVVDLVTQFELVSVEAGEPILRLDDPREHLYLIRSGTAAVRRKEDGEFITIDRKRSGDYFGERALLVDDPWPGTVEVRAEEETSCYRLNRDDFSRLLDASPELREEMVKRLDEEGRDQEIKKKYSTAPPARPRVQLDVRADQDNASVFSGDRPDVTPADLTGTPFKKRRRLRGYPWVQQQDETDCGAACLAMISRYYGVRLSVGRLRDLANVGREGASLHSLSVAAEKLGYTTRAVKTDYGHLMKTALPVIAHWKGYHYIVVYRVHEKHVVLGDPAAGLIKMKRQAFEAGWTGTLLLLNPTPQIAQHEHEQTTFRRFLPLIKPYRMILLEVFLASLLLDILGLSFPLFTRMIIDDVLVHQDVSLLNIMLSGMILVGVFHTLTAVLRQYLLIHVGTRLSLTMESGLFRHITGLTMRYFHTRRIGDILTRFSDLDEVREMMTGSLVTTLLDVLTIGVYLALMFYYNAELTAIALVFIPLSALLTLIFTPFLQRSNQAVFEQEAKSRSNLLESIASIQTIKACAAELTMRWKHEDAAVQAARAEFRRDRLDLALSISSGTLRMLGMVILLWYGAHLVVNAQMTLGQLMAFMILVGLVTTPIMSLIGMWHSLQDGLLSIQRVSDVYESEPEEKNRSSLIALPHIEGHIKFDNVSFRYNPDDPNILANITLEIQPGQTAAIVGRSGSGKTTMTNLLQRFYTPTEGRILIDGYDISSLSVQSLRSRIGVVLQETTLFSSTIRDNIAMTDPDASMDRIIDAARMAGAHDFIVSFPMGYDTVIGETGIHLSGGQKQRIAIARALLNDPRILIFDEATSSLDTESERAVQRNMEAVLSERTAIIIAHRISTIQGADLIIVLDDGMIVEQGTHQALLDNRGLYYYMNGQQLTRS